MITDTSFEAMLSFPVSNVSPNNQSTHSVPPQIKFATPSLFANCTNIQMAPDFSPVPNCPFSVWSLNAARKEPSIGASASGYSTASASSSAFSSPCPEVAQAFQDFNWAETDHELVLQAEVTNDFCSNGYLADIVDLNRLYQEKCPGTFDDFSLVHPVLSGLGYHPTDIISNLHSTLLPRSGTASPAPYGDHIVQHRLTAMSAEDLHFCPASLDDRRFFNTSIESSHLQQQTSMDNSEQGHNFKKKARCPEPHCRRVVKNLKAHLLTHQSERPEKCPIVTCAYHIKGFARKYDRDRHNWTHYKGTMICGFCAEFRPPMKKSFNRLDVFKRHLTVVHGVEQISSKCRDYIPTSSTEDGTIYGGNTTGKCSTCLATFSSAPEFYKHLDGCVMRAVEQEQSSEDINRKDREVHKLPSFKASTSTSHPIIGNDSIFAKGSFAAVAGKNRRIRAFSNHRKGLKLWGYSNSRIKKNKEKKKNKRVLYVFKGQHRLWGDEMILKTGSQALLRLSKTAGSGSHRDAYVTVLDVESIKDVLGSNEERGAEVED